MKIWGITKAALIGAAFLCTSLHCCSRQVLASEFVFPAIAPSGCVVQGIREVGKYGRPAIYFVKPIEIPEKEVKKEDGERKELYKLVHSEAGNQPLDGKRLVADTVINRKRSESFPNSIHEVIYQKGGYSVIADGAFDRAEGHITTEDRMAVDMELDGEQLNTEVLYFSADEWPDYGTPWEKVGDHYFCTK